MKERLKKCLMLVLTVAPIAASAQLAPQIMNVTARQTTSLDGQWKTIVDPFENGYYDYRLNPYDGGYAQHGQRATDRRSHGEGGGAAGSHDGQRPAGRLSGHHQLQRVCGMV